MSSTHLRGAAQHPDPPADHTELGGFPVRVVGGTWFRSHVDMRAQPDHGCWWFASVRTGDPDRSGRFDLPHPDGTCYLGSSAEVAARERVGPYVKSIAGREYASAAVLATPDGPLVVTEVPLDPVRAANLPVKGAMRWVNRSLSVGTGIYSITQEWAVTFRAAGFEGIVYQPRFTGGQRARALALFGAAGAPDPRPSVGGSRGLRDVMGDIGIEVLPSKPPIAAAVLPTGTAPPAL